MKIAIALTQTPFITGGAEVQAKLLKEELAKRGHFAETVTIPFKWYPAQSLLDCMLMGRMMDLTEVNGERIDRVIGLKFPAYYAKHDDKVLWVLHQHRQAYDLWGTEYGDLDRMDGGKEVKDLIVKCDNMYISEAKYVYTDAQNAADRLKKYNDIEAVALYHPPMNYEKLYCGEYKDYVFYPSRIDGIKRQRLVVEAAKHFKSDAKVVIAGGGSKKETAHLKKIISDNHLENRVVLAGFISEEEKLDYYANCFAVYFGAYNEDYGYVTLEGFFAEKPVIVHPDSGGPLEFVEDGRNGYVVEADARKIAEKIDYLYENKGVAEQMGKSGRDSLVDKHMDWDYVIEKLLLD